MTDPTTCRPKEWRGINVQWCETHQRAWERCQPPTLTEDEQIVARLAETPGLSPAIALFAAPAVRHLLDVQAAAHADADAENIRLKAWKAEASEVLDRWEKVFQAIPVQVRQAPQNLGRSKADVVFDFIRFREGA